MKTKMLLLLLLVAGLQACKKDKNEDDNKTGVVEFDLDGKHHEFNVAYAEFSVDSTPGDESKYYYLTSLDTGGAFLMYIADYGSPLGEACIPKKDYQGSDCDDCDMFEAAYSTDNIIYTSYTDSRTKFTLTACSGDVNPVISGTFQSKLFDDDGGPGTRTITNGKLHKVTFTRQ